MITCQDARLALWPEPGPRAESPEAAVALAHYRECAKCQRFFAFQTDLGRRLRRVGQAEVASDRLRERVREAIGAARLGQEKRWRRIRASAFGALAAAALAIFLLYPGSGGTSERLARPFVAEVLQDLPDDLVDQRDPRLMAAWFAERIGYAVPVIEIADAELYGGRVVSVGGVQSAVFYYRMHGMPLVYFVVPGERILGQRFADGQVMRTASEGLEVVIWGEPGAAHAVSAPMPQQQLVEIAAECRRKLRAT